MMDFLVILFLKNQNPAERVDLAGCVKDEELISIPINRPYYLERLDSLGTRQCFDRVRLLCTNRLMDSN